MSGTLPPSIHSGHYGYLSELAFHAVIASLPTRARLLLGVSPLPIIRGFYQ